MPVELWDSPAAAETVLSTEMDALANNARTILGPEYDNATKLYVHLVAELLADLAATPTVNTTLDLYYIPAFDGSNYADGSDTVAPPADRYCCSFQSRAVATDQRIVSNPFVIPPFKGKFLLHNNGTGVAMGASGHTVRVRPANREVV